MFDEEKLYHACIDFCRTFNGVICLQNHKLRGFPLDDADKVLLQRELDFEERHLKDDFKNLCAIVDELRRV